jgi:6-phosphogluconolactonase
MGAPGLAAEAANPTFLAIHPRGHTLYAVNAIDNFQGEHSGALSAFRLDAKTGALTLLNQQRSGGIGPCHVSVNRAGTTALTANYGSGSIASLPLEADGRLRFLVSEIQHHGTGPNRQRQEGPHAHSINLDPTQKLAVAADLGLDQLLLYRFDGATGKLSPHDPPFARTAAGAGPRHFAFHPSGRWGYVINELDSTVTAYRYDAAAGTLSEIQAISTVPAGFQGENYPAEVVVDAAGRFLYGSNRGHDSIAIFRIDDESGKLTAVGHQPSDGKWPRNFVLDPSGRWMVVGNQNSGNVLLMHVDPLHGTLTPTGVSIEIPAAICFRTIPIAN